MLLHISNTVHFFGNSSPHLASTADVLRGSWGYEGGYTSPLPRHLPKFDQGELGTRENQDGAHGVFQTANGTLVDNNAQLRIECARILQERGLVFQISGLFTSGSFNRD